MPDLQVPGFELSAQQKLAWPQSVGVAPLRSQIAVMLSGTLDVGALRQALSTTVERYEILRTTFRLRIGLKWPLQFIQDEMTPSWTSDASHDNMLDTKWAELLGEPVDLAEGPVIRVLLSCVASNRHLLLLSLPSMCADSRSLGLLASNLASAYAVAADSSDEPMPLQYADYAAWQEELYQGSDNTSRQARDFWNQPDFCDAPALKLPGQHESAPSSTAIRVCPLSFDAPLTAELEKFSVTSGIAPDIILLSAWSILLWRLSGQTLIGTNVVAAGRSLQDLDTAIGAFAHPIPIICQPTSDVTFAAYVAEITEVDRESNSWQDFYVDNPGFTPGFSYIAHADSVVTEGVTFETIRQTTDASHSALALACRSTKDGLDCELSFDPSLFDKDAVEHFGCLYTTLLASALAKPGAPLGTLDLMDKVGRLQVIVDWNQTKADYPRDQCLHWLFEKQAVITPDAAAVRCNTSVLTYKQLNYRANQLAHYLRKQSISGDVPVGLCVERSIDQMVAVLAIWKAGGAYVPLSAEHPIERLAHQIAETRAPLVITQSAFVAHLGDLSVPRLCMDSDRALFASEPETNPDHYNSPDDLAYVIYTSGSTGQPKGVANTHGGLVNYSWAMRNLLGMDSHEMHCATVSTLTADLGNTCLYPPLISGGCVHILDYQTATDGAKMSAYAADYPYDVLKITPSHLSALLGSGGRESLLPRCYLVLGGEAATWKLIDSVRAAGSCRIINHYGPTETTIGSLTYRVPEQPGGERCYGSVPLGRPLANTEAYVLDELLQPVPHGVVGELCLGGAGLARGYMNQPERTDEGFVLHPFNSKSGARIYRTGDRVRYLPDGNIEFLGRLDDQVKIRGFRVEPAEVENVIRRHPAVQSAVVLTLDSDADGKRLVGYVVPNLRAELSTATMRAHLLLYLPEYMIPSEFVVIEALPLTANGKVDRNALVALDPNRNSASSHVELLCSPLEESLKQIWSEVLGVPRVGIHDSFFDLGGHSLSAIRLISRIREVMSVSVSMTALFEAPTIAELGSIVAIEQAQQSTDDATEALLSELGNLSDEEIERLLQ